ncbi:MAG: DUF6065 family protein [Myxococcota bacterium]|nr:DUF6065 family protein [Myxococcota bacterium]
MSTKEREIYCYLREGAWIHIRPSSPKRKWMDQTPFQHAYKCLPLTHANQHGWEMLLKQGFSVHWNGGAKQEDIRFHFEGTSPDGHPPVLSAFGSGIITFRIPCLFKTPKGVNLWVMGVPNIFLDGAQPLSGIVETDWLEEYGFTMNWKITRPNVSIHFPQHFPFGFLVPVERGYIESFQPYLRSFEHNPSLKAVYESAEEGRRNFQRRIKVEDSETHLHPNKEQKRNWQGNYYRGQTSSGTIFSEHQTKLYVKAFKVDSTETEEEE